MLPFGPKQRASTKMQLVNRTPMMAESTFSEGFVRSSVRYVMVTAKVTFTFDESGRIGLEPDVPYPIFAHDVPTPLGLLPSDGRPRADPVFEVILLGKAHAAGGSAVRQRRVSLAVGDVRRELDGFGDRVWTQRDAVSRPERFVEMPLTYERAFGGGADALVDAASRMRVSDATNKLGRGWDAEGYLKGLGEALRAPPGYPRIPGYVRRLPNLEDPRNPIRRWEDAPTPVSWATVPLDLGLRMKWLTDRIRDEQPYTEEEAVARAYHRAHPDWIIPLPPPSAVVELLGLLPTERVSFRLPRIRPVVDILNQPHKFSAPLVPQMLVLLPDEGRFYLVYRTIASLDFVPQADRGLRLRTEDRWGPDDDGGPLPPSMAPVPAGRYR